MATMLTQTLVAEESGEPPRRGGFAGVASEGETDARRDAVLEAVLPPGVRWRPEHVDAAVVEIDGVRDAVRFAEVSGDEVQRPRVVRALEETETDDRRRGCLFFVDVRRDAQFVHVFAVDLCDAVRERLFSSQERLNPRRQCLDRPGAPVDRAAHAEPLRSVLAAARTDDAEAEASVRLRRRRQPPQRGRFVRGQEVANVLHVEPVPAPHVTQPRRRRTRVRVVAGQVHHRRAVFRRG
mmetsp:Transcript_16802/g.50979  ORF Transcript_16802/g.50979 Transcript_16802/m.50979 type:complete len:238 (-) Transcript_16802:159-872(-)